MNQARQCPDCGALVTRTRLDNISAHITPNGKPCQASYGRPYTETLTPQAR
jgi:hypothetical protein